MMLVLTGNVVSIMVRVTSYERGAIALKARGLVLLEINLYETYTNGRSQMTHVLLISHAHIADNVPRNMLNMAYDRS